MQALELARKSTFKLYKHIEWLLQNHNSQSGSSSGLAEEVRKKAIEAGHFINGIEQDSRIGLMLRETMQGILNLEALLKIGSGSDIDDVENQVALIITQFRKLLDELKKDVVTPSNYLSFRERFPSELTLEIKELTTFLAAIQGSRIDFQLLLLLGRYNETSRVFDRNGKKLTNELREIKDGLDISNSIVGTFLELGKRSHNETLRKYYYGLAVYRGALEVFVNKSYTGIPADENFRKILVSYTKRNEERFLNNPKRVVADFHSGVIDSMRRIKITLSSEVNPISVHIAHLYRRLKAVSKKYRVIKDIDVVRQSSSFVKLIAEEAYNTGYAKYEKKLPGLRRTVSLLNKL